MDSPSFFEDSTVNNEASLRKQLSIYQSINSDLSKKIQQLKIELNSSVKELNNTRNELIEEKRKFSELRRLFFTANSHCVSYFNSYFSTIQLVNEIGEDLNFTLPVQDRNDSQSVEGKKILNY